ncbi:Hypothetical protein A7982_01368 [Minicystis rosea]|nr:Hypothetical protein A7982_01368 [Minicystis rosea]
MSDFRPFVDQDGIEGELLRSALDDQASIEARERARAAMGRAISGGGGGGGGGSGGPSALPPAQPVRIGLTAKWIGAISAATFVVAATIAILTFPIIHRTPAPSVAMPSVPAPDAPPPPLPLVSAAPTAAAPAEAAEVTTAPPAVSAPPRTAPSAAAPGPSLADEVAALDKARHALAGGDASGALAALDSYARAFPRGVLREAASVLRVEALVRGGQRAAAADLARRMLRAHPKSPYAVKLRSLVPEADTNP